MKSNGTGIHCLASASSIDTDDCSLAITWFDKVVKHFQMNKLTISVVEAVIMHACFSIEQKY